LTLATICIAAAIPTMYSIGNGAAWMSAELEIVVLRVMTGPQIVALLSCRSR
jgi:hypothetical protein